VNTTTIYTSTNSRRCASCSQPMGRCLPTCPDMSVVINPPWMLKDSYVGNTIDCSDDGLSWTGIMEAFVEVPQSHAKGRIHVPRVPVGGIVMIMLGLVLMTIGFGLNGPISWWLYGMLHG
jgi:hypothetical protein